MEVRRLAPGDEALLQQALMTFRGPDDRADGAFLDDPANVAFVSVDGGEVLGWVWGHELRRPSGLLTMLLYEVEVSEKARRQGIGRKLVDAFVAEARARGHHKMWLFTDAGNQAAQNLYEGAGGEPGPKVGYWWVFE